MKKKVLLFLLPIGLLCSCGSDNLQNKKYVYSEDATEIKADLMNKLNEASTNFSWKGISLTSSFEMKGEGNINITETTQTLTSDISLSVNAKEDLKVSFDMDQLSKETPEYEKVANAKMSAEFDVDMKNGNVEQNIDCDVDLAYGYTNIKPTATSEAVNSDFLFGTAVLKTDYLGFQSTTTTGILQYGLAQGLTGQISSSQIPGLDEETLAQIQELSAVIENSCGFQKDGNSYYVEINFKTLVQELMSKTTDNSTDNSFIDSSLGLSDAQIDVDGKAYLKIAFAKDNTLESITASVKDLKVDITVKNQISLKLQASASAELKSYNKKVDAPSQKDVDSFGYDNIQSLM